MSNENLVFKLISLPLSGKSNSRYLLAAKASGLEFSVDGGQTWEDGYRSLKADSSLGTLAMATIPTSDSYHQVYAGLSGGILTTFIGIDISNFTWQKSKTPSPLPTITDFAISPNFDSDGIIFAGTLDDGVLRSSDHGKTWVGWNFNLIDLSVLCLKITPTFVKDSTVFAGTASGLFVSHNDGKSWKDLPLPCGNEPVLSLAVSPNYEIDGRIWAGTESQGLWHSKDWGEFWKQDKSLTGSSPINILDSIKISDDECQLFAASNNWIKYKTFSQQRVESWQDIKGQIPQTNITAICIQSEIKTSAILWVGYSNGQVHSIEGTWINTFAKK
jgi:hypothetical protein